MERDLRGLSPKEKADTIIENCAHKEYKDMLRDCFLRSKRYTYNNHTAHLLNEALYYKFLRDGLMK